MSHFIIKNNKKPSPWRYPVVAIAFFVIWVLLSRWVNRELLLPSPFVVGQHLFKLAQEAAFWQSVAFSLLRIGAGFLLGLVSGILLAVLCYVSSWAMSFVKPIMSVIRATPVASFIILTLVWISRQGVPAFMAFLMVLPQVFASITLALSQVDQQFLELAQLFELTNWKTVRYIFLPSVLPELLSAAVSALGLAWKAGVAAEVLSSPNNAIGTKILESKRYLETADLFAWTIVIILLSMFLEMFFRRFSARLLKGQEREASL